MEGVRVTGIDSQCSVQVLWQYFDDKGGMVKDIYYPLLNNDAVIIFRKPSGTTEVLTSNHEKWKVLPLPNQVFTKQRVWVESDLSMLVQATGAYEDSLRNMGQVDISVDSTTSELILTGQPYQIEWAWNYLSSLRDNQYHIARTLQTEAMNSSASRLSNGPAIPGYLSTYERSRQNNLQSPRLSRETKSQNKEKTSREDLMDVMSLGLGGLSNTHHGAHPRSSTLFADVPGGSPMSEELRDEETLISSMTQMTALGFCEEQGSRQGLDARERRRRQDDANETFNKFASLPPGSSVAASRESRELLRRTDPGHHSSTRANSGSKSDVSPNTLPSQAELERAEAAHRSERQFQSLDYRGLGEREDFRGAAGNYQSLQADFVRQNENMDSSGVKTKGAYPGERGTSYLTTSYGGVSESSPYGLSSASVELSQKVFQLGKRLTLKIYVDDITKTKTDAVVNAANWELKNIGGVAGALAKAAGPEMAMECNRLFQKHGSLATAQVVKTKAYGKLAHLKYVVHTVGPIYIATDTERSVFELAQTFYNCLQFAENLHLTSVTFPFISTGIFGMPIEHCILSLVTALRVFSEERSSSLGHLEEVHFINNDINVVCEAIIMMEQRLSMESVETARQRFDEGVQRFGRYVYPYCQGSVSRTSLQKHDSERYARWDSSQSRHRVGAEDTNNSRSGTAGLRGPDPSGDTKEPWSLPNFKATSDSRQRSSSLDRGSRTVTLDSSQTKSSQKTGGRDPSPRPQARPRSNLLTLSGKPLSTSPKDTASTSQTTSTGKHQPVIKKSLTGVSNKATGLAKKLASKKTAHSSGRGTDLSGNDTDSASAAGSEMEDTDRSCMICFEPHRQPKQLACGHTFCRRCIELAFAVKPGCPRCEKLYGVPIGDQPSNGMMSFTYNRHSDLPGYEDCGTLVIKYVFPSGIQEVYHPEPGRHYEAIHHTAYLPNNAEGSAVLNMLQKAFDQRLVFTIGEGGVITWNDIHHKTSKTGGPEQFGYPDPQYLKRVKEELAAKGITYP